MKLGFLKLSPDERRLYIEQAAIQRNVSAVILEKDFWVCWLLGILFRSEFAGSLVFKDRSLLEMAQPFARKQVASNDASLRLFRMLHWLRLSAMLLEGRRNQHGHNARRNSRVSYRGISSVLCALHRKLCPSVVPST